MKGVCTINRLTLYQYSMPLPLQVAFVAGSSGIWRIERITAVAGESIPPAERLAVIEGPVGMEYLPAVARRLHHSRELGEPFDFLTWFEFAPEHADAFEEVVRRLPSTAEWRYVEREVDIRASR